MRSRTIEHLAKPQWQPRQTNDRRRSERVSISYDGRIMHKDRCSAVRVVNLSRHGVRVCGPGSFKAGDNVIVELAAPWRRLQLAGRVVWNDHCRKRMGGITFDELTRDDTLALHATLAEARREEGYAHDVLVVTDDPDAQLALADGIWEHAHAVAMRTTVDSALEYLSSSAPRARAALVSAKLPDREGHRLLDVLAQTYPAIRRVLLVDNMMDATHALGTSMPDFVLLSPYHRDGIEGALRGISI